METWNRIRALFYIILYITATPLCVMITLVLWIYGSVIKISKVPKGPALTGTRRTVLVLGASSTKALHVIRTLGKQGHTVIVADCMTYQYVGARWSKYVAKFYVIPTKYNEDMTTYVEQVLDIVKKEDIDWCIPVSHIHYSIANTQVTEALSKIYPKIKCLNLTNVALTTALDDKIQFSKECARLGLSVPDFHLVSKIADIRLLRNRGIFEKRHFFLKPLATHSEDRGKFRRIPHNVLEFNQYVREYEDKISRGELYIVCEFIRGREYASNVICRRGKLIAFQVCPSSMLMKDYDVVDHPKIHNWVEKFCSNKQLTGCLCFDFIEEEESGKLYCLECNPRLHSCIVSYYCDKSLEVALRTALEPSQEERFSYPIKPSLNSPHAYWLYNEIAKLCIFRTSLFEFIRVLVRGKEAVMDSEDPLPFLVLNTIQMIELLRQKLLSGKYWHSPNPCLGQVA